MAINLADRSVNEIRTALDTDALLPLPTYDDTDRWNQVQRDDRTGPVAERIVGRATALRDRSLPPLKASSYLEFVRSGDRNPHDGRSNERRARLTWFALAECFDREGDYLDSILDYAWDLCQQETWVAPAHFHADDYNDPDADFDHDGLPRFGPDRKRYLDIYPVHTAQTLVEIDHVLGDRLHPALRDRIRREVEAQIFTPFEARDDFWWLDNASNHNPVNCGGIITLALHLLNDAPDRRASLIRKAVQSMEGYINGFGVDGCTPEGIGYWSYGFGAYLRAAVDLRTVSSGSLDLLDGPTIPAITKFPVRSELVSGQWPTFSDSDPDDTPEAYVTCKLGDLFDDPALADLGLRSFERRYDKAFPTDHTARFEELVRTLLWTADTEPPDTVPDRPLRQYFGGHDWWITRQDAADGIVVAAKGGSNADELHNHNDCGQFVVYAGEPLLVDLGPETYDDEYFGERRYEYLAARSLGHSVPLIDGEEQASGPAHRASVTDREEGETCDVIEFDLSACYPSEAKVKRRISLNRRAGTVTVADETDADTWQSVLVTDTPIDETTDGLVVSGKRRTLSIEFETDAETSVERIPEGVRGRDVWRARLTPPGSTLALTIRAIDGDPD